MPANFTTEHRDFLAQSLASEIGWFLWVAPASTIRCNKYAQTAITHWIQLLSTTAKIRETTTDLQWLQVRGQCQSTASGTPGVVAVGTLFVLWASFGSACGSQATANNKATDTPCRTERCCVR